MNAGPITISYLTFFSYDLKEIRGVQLKQYTMVYFCTGLQLQSADKQCAFKLIYKYLLQLEPFSSKIKLTLSFSQNPQFVFSWLGGSGVAHERGSFGECLRKAL